MDSHCVYTTEEALTKKEKEEFTKIIKFKRPHN